MQNKLFKPGVIFLYTLTMIGMGSVIGWYAHQPKSSPNSPLPSLASTKPIRLAGYDLISPLIVCDSDFRGNSPALDKLEQQVAEVIKEQKRQGSITQASVYVRDLQSGSELNLNKDEKFFPASLKKLPLMMQYFYEAEANPELLLTKKPLLGTVDYNAGTVLPPANAPKYGNSYSADELIAYMIKYSDNTSFETLYPALGQSKFDKIYKQMQLNYPNSFASVDDVGDYATPYQFSLFFRALYNATYLNNDGSEKALKLLSQADFKSGIVAGVPADVTVAHKFGVSTVTQDSGTAQGELHDCGIVYNKRNPYILCIMTKGESDVHTVEQSIAQISEVVYKAAESDYQ